METNYLSHPLASLGVTAIVVLMLIGYFWVRPRLRDHDGWRAYFDLHFIVVMWMLTLCITVLAPWRWPTTWPDVMYDIFQIRVGGGPSNAHIWTYLTIPLLFFIAYHGLRLATWQSFLTATFMVFLHEGIWFIYYYAHYFTLLTLALVTLQDVNYLALVGACCLIYWRVYGLNRTILIVVAPQFLYDSVWYVIGFPITYSSDPAVSATFNIPQWSTVLWVNQIEVCGWLLMFASMIVWLKLDLSAKPQTKIVSQAIAKIGAHP